MKSVSIRNARLIRLLIAEQHHRFDGSGRKGTPAAVLEQLALERLEQLKRDREGRA